ncbi:hypothetical protein PpBr36_07736 [Pyricularia pennisetigena]|uniref:hypothetical protein n=1 Tax=Pyricularia pennisetigena TaxID=1578925 RepID=UPI001153F1E1|nr:hypothetical protein PpBr36_07736 [Pyricularia pennisetigena]TLS25494.1 hypothetical protein PpBr36_07736 [Pyricularia pennisetigena]
MLACCMRMYCTYEKQNQRALQRGENKHVQVVARGAGGPPLRIDILDSEGSKPIRPTLEPPNLLGHARGGPKPQTQDPKMQDSECCPFVAINSSRR